MPNQYDRFYQANLAAGDIVKEMEPAFSIWGRFTIDAADFIVDLARREFIAPELLAVTWQNEYTFGFYAPANTNTQPDDFSKHDVGPFQLNVGLTQADLEVNFFSSAGIDLKQAFGTISQRFNGDAFENGRLAARKLLALGRGRIICQLKDGTELELFAKLSVDDWKLLSKDERNERRAIAYCGKRSRRHRQDKWQQFGPMFKTFFEKYAK